MKTLVVEVTLRADDVQDVRQLLEHCLNNIDALNLYWIQERPATDAESKEFTDDYGDA